MTLHAPRRTETIAPARDASPDAALPIVPAALNDSAPPPAALAQPTAQTVTNIAPAIPTVDLSASLGAQVVDMGVSGQWIDGLARDIASLSANGAQGRFQINATELGPVEVNIRQGDDGAAISLTVATEAAEQALRQDGDRLKLDASLSAVRISEVKIERAPHVAEVTRAEGSTNQNTAQQQSGGSHQNQGQAAGQNMGQSSTQSHMQGRGQQRENIAFGHKAGNDGAVLNHMDAGDTAGGAVRARYA
ncbi:flagellar hook-length control protein FliK [Sphingobium limneticum]|nr:flagellar hook-length control protein FliK [Sphingobium limneticum]